ncbi:MAG: diadenylate cyclase CdaA [Streptococcaceae bacterium]|jgi:diadenylate cyclase|nr:diadenylate cyclase CdaA [Streptococcaceae bacterium]
MNLSEIFSRDFWTQFFTKDLFLFHFFISILDILVVWFLIFKVVQMLEKTKAIQLIKGVVLFFVIRFLAEFIGLTTITWIMNQVITYGVIAGIVIFQPEIRQGLERLGRVSVLSVKKKQGNSAIVASYIKSVSYMSKRKIGALITIEQSTDLSDFIETGIALDADLTGELLINIFIPNTPLHDGAVIVKENKILAASAYLPLTENQGISKEFGTRHRAAIGISEVSDALTIVVSEETGGISITEHGLFTHSLTLEELEAKLTSALIKEERRLSVKEQVMNFFQKEGKKP